MIVILLQALVDAIDQVCMAAIAPAIALAGVLLTLLITNRQHNNQAKQQNDLEKLRREWAVADKQADQSRGILERRCQQFEQFADEIMDAFFNIYDTCWAMLDAPTAAEANMAAWEGSSRRERVDTKAMKSISIVKSARDKELEAAFRRMADEMNAIEAIADQIADSRLPGARSNVQEQREGLNTIRIRFQDVVSDFYRRIDQIRVAAMQSKVG